MAAHEEPASLFKIPDVLCSKVGCKSVWGLGNQIFIYAGDNDRENEASMADCPPCKIHQVVWDTEMHGPILRKLVNETQNIFLKLQEQAANSSSKKKISMIQISREYRSVIKACSMELRETAHKSHNPAEQQNLEAQFELFEIIELIWSLSEILFVETAPGGVVLNQLLDWLRVHFVEGTRMAQESMQLESPEEHPKYWQAVYLLVLQGRLDDARHMLSVNSERQSELFIIMDRLLQRMPVFGKFTGQSLAEFDMRWQHWQEECSQVLEEGTFVADKQLELICRILCGDEDVFVSPEVVDLLGSWYCMLISKLLYQNPTVKVFDLQYHTQKCIEAYGGHARLQQWDNILLAAIEYDIHQVIKESSMVLGNWWFVAHMNDLIHHAGKLESQTLGFGSNLREFLLLEYASSLMSHHSLWQVGVNYLDHCPEFGHYYLEQFIERMPMETEKKTQKILRICEQRDMQDQTRSICKVMGMRALHNHRLGSALSWALRSKDESFATVVAEKLLFKYHESGGFSSLDLVDNLGSSMLLSSQLTFLGKYREFHKLYEDGDFTAAASLLLSLLTAKIAPKKFWPTLLLDALPLLEAENVVFSGQQTYELMHCVEHLNLDKRLESKKQKKDIEGKNPKVTKTGTKVDQGQREVGVEGEKMDLMRLALARNLARAIVHEGTVDCM